MGHSLIKIVLFTSALLPLWSTILLAQAETANTFSNLKNPKVGLVLSGGGAKGLAHIGVLQAIEEVGVRIDFIGGTSMGAIVGGLYAAGYNAEELQQIFDTIDFDAFIQDVLPRQAKTFYEREDSEKYAITLPFDKFKIGLPKGFSRGQNLYNQFSRYTAHVSHVRDFNKLPIPFFCMATNVASGEQILLDRGYLPQAVTASGALPTVFDPVEINGALLIDGGVSNNYPIDEIIQKGAEIIIGIDVQDSLTPKEQLNSISTIIPQLANFRTMKEMEEKIKQTDIYIKPSIDEFSILSFDKIEKIIKNGKNAALLHLKTLQQIAKLQQDEDTRVEQLMKQAVPRKSDSIQITALNISGNKRYTRSYIKGKLKLRKIPKSTTYTKLYEGINNLSSTDNFEKVNHKIIPTTAGEQLNIKLTESKKKMLLRLAVHYDDLFQTAGLINVTRKRILFDNDVFSADIVLGDNIRYNLDYYIDKGYYWSVGLKYQYTEFQKNTGLDFIRLFGDIPNIAINTVEVNYTDFTTQLYLETLLHQTFAVGIGAEFDRLRVVSNTFDNVDSRSTSVFEDSNYWSAFGTVRFDSYNNKYFPTEGFLFQGDVHAYLFANTLQKPFSEFSIAKASLGYATPISDRIALQFEIAAGAKIGNTSIRSFDFLLGGFGARTLNNFIPFYGYNFLGIAGQSFVKLALGLDYRFYKKHHFHAAVNYANVDAMLFNSNEWFRRPEFSGYSIGYGLETFVGPIQLKYNYSPQLKENIWFTSIGFWF